MEEILLEKEFKQFRHPGLTIFSGPSNSGKTTLVLRILANLSYLFDIIPKRIIFLYSEWQPAYEQISNQVEFSQNLDQDMYDSFDSKKPTLLIADDFQMQATKNDLLCKIAIQGGHHRSVSTFILLQNFYFGSDVSSINIRRSAQYIVLMSSPQDKKQIRSLGSQMFPQNLTQFIEAYEDATENTAFGHLLIDCRPDTQKYLRVRSDILCKEPLIYVVNHK